MPQGIGRGVILFAAAVCAALFAFASTSQLAMASTVQVGTCLTGPPRYPTIQGAVTAVSPGSTIRVCPGQYAEQVTITKPLALVGVQSDSGSTPEIISPAAGIVQNATGLGSGVPVGAQILVQNTHGVGISGLTIDGSNNQLSTCIDLMGIYYQNASGIVNFVVTQNQNLGAGNQCQSGEGIFAQSGYGYSGSAAVVIENSNVYGYQKNGITGDGDTLTVTVTGNDVFGAGPDAYVAQNGIQISVGTKATLLNNSVTNDIYTGTSYAASGILVYAASGVNIEGNFVSNTQGVVTYSGGTLGSADQTTIISNRVLETDTYDAIDVCSNDNSLVSNMVFGSSEGGIHLDDSCTEPDNSASGNNNTVTKNRINDVCAGVLLGSGTGNTISPNSIFNADYTDLAGDSCNTAPVAAVAGKPAKSRPRPLPVKP